MTKTAISSGWKQVPLTELLKLKQSGIWGNEGEKEDYPVLRSSNIHNGKLILTDVAYRKIPPNKVAAYELENGDILVTKSSGSSHLIGKSCIFRNFEKKCYLFSNFTQRLRTKKEVLLPEFLYYYLNSSFAKETLQRISNTTSGLRNLNMKEYGKQLIPVPPIPVQKKVAAILEKADAAREKRRQANQLTEQFLQSAFLEMFGDPVINPMEWPVMSIKEVALSDKGSIKCGPFGSQLLLGELIKDGIPVYGIDNVQRNSFVWAKQKFISKEKFEELKAFIVRPDDVLISRTGTVGRACLAPDDVPKSIIGPNLLKVSLDKTKLLPIVLSCALSYCHSVIEKVKQMSPGATVPVFNTENLKKLSLPIPLISEQQKFAALLKKVESLHARQRQSEQELETLFNSLMQRAFRGEL